jgi:hypothetical protein
MGSACSGTEIQGREIGLRAPRVMGKSRRAARASRQPCHWNRKPACASSSSLGLAARHRNRDKGCNRGQAPAGMQTAHPPKKPCPGWPCARTRRSSPRGRRRPLQLPAAQWQSRSERWQSFSSESPLQESPISPDQRTQPPIPCALTKFLNLITPPPNRPTWASINSGRKYQQDRPWASPATQRPSWIDRTPGE